MSERPIIFTADVEVQWSRFTQSYFAVLRIGQHEIARWLITYDEHEHLSDTDNMEQFVAEKLSALFGARRDDHP